MVFKSFFLSGQGYFDERCFFIQRAVIRIDFLYIGKGRSSALFGKAVRTDIKSGCRSSVKALFFKFSLFEMDINELLTFFKPMHPIGAVDVPVLPIENLLIIVFVLQGQTKAGI